MAGLSDEYRTITTRSRVELKIQASRFIAAAAPAITREDADRFIEEVRKEYFDATHHCFAYRLGTQRDLFRFNDDGEPGGSAGKPILSAIDKRELTETVVVVTRYFGGTKLGVGGLVRAYGASAEKALASAGYSVRHVLETVRAAFPHAHISNVMHIVSKLGATIVDTTYDEEVHLDLRIRMSRAEELKTLLMNQTHGNIRLTH